MEFERFPDLVRPRIYSFLLGPIECCFVDENHDSALLKRRYVFHTAIMRVNKEISYEARDYFSKMNRFVLVSANVCPRDLLARHLRVGLFDASLTATPFTKRLDHITAHMMHVTINSYDRKKHAYSLFVLPLADISELIFALRFQQASQIPHFKFRFDFHQDIGSMLPVSVQRKLLDPFEAIRGVAQVCKIIGEVDEKLAASVVSKVTTLYTVNWGKGVALDAYDLAMTLKSRADLMLASNKSPEAWKLYHKIVRLFKSVVNFCDSTERVDESVMNRWKKLTVVATSIAHRLQWLDHQCMWFSGAPLLRRRDFVHGEKIYMDQNLKIHNTWIDVIEHWCYDERLELDAAFILLARLGIDPALVDQAQEICAYDWTEYTRDSVEQMSRLADLTQLVPPMPEYPPEYWAEPIDDAGIDEERYILRNLGYNGNFFEDRIRQKPGIYFDDDGREISGVFHKARADSVIVEGLKRLEETRRTQGYEQTWLEDFLKPTKPYRNHDPHEL